MTFSHKSKCFVQRGRALYSFRASCVVPRPVRTQSMCTPAFHYYNMPCIIASGSGMTDGEISACFQHCLPALAAAAGDKAEPSPNMDLDSDQNKKRPRQEPQPNGRRPPQWGRGGGKGHGGRQQQGRHNRDQQELEQIVGTLCRLTLRQEEELQLLRTEKQFLLHMESANHGMLATFWQIAQAWKADKAKTPPTVKCSLRVTLIRCMMLEWKQRLTTMTQSEETVKELVKHELVKADAGDVLWYYQTWNQTTQRLEIDQHKPPLTNSAVIQMATELNDLVHKEAENLIHRFHSTRKLTERVQGDTMPFILAVAMRGLAANRAFEILHVLEGNASLRVIGVRLRSERVQLQPLAQQLRKQTDAMLL